MLPRRTGALGRVTPPPPPSLLQAIVSTYSAYYVFLPTIVSDFLTYSLCRLDDWSWGNKDKMVATPSGGGAVVSGSCGGEDRLRKAFAPPLSPLQKDTSSQWTQTYIVSNFTPFLILFGNFGVAGLIMWLACVLSVGQNDFQPCNAPPIYRSSCSYANIKVALAALGQAFTGIGLSIMCCR